MESKTGKIALVVIGVVLMMVFILPPAMTGGGGGGRSTIGTVNGEEISPDEVRNAQALFSNAQRIYVQTSFGTTSLPVYLMIEPALRRLSFDQGAQTMTMVQQSLLLAQQAMQTLERDPVTFYLLLREARQNGVDVPLDRVEDQLVSRNASILIDSQGGSQPVPFTELTGDAIRGRYLHSAKAIADVMLSANRYSDFTKISRPLADFFVAQAQQEVTLDVVVFDADTYLGNVPAPADDEITKQFERYRDVIAGNHTDENPFGFGYRLPDRVKLQYLAIERADVEASIRQRLAEQTVRERELVLFNFWKANRIAFAGLPTTQPSTQPSTQPTTEPTTEPSTQPTTEPSTQPVDADLLMAVDNPAVKSFLDEQSAAMGEGEAAEEWTVYVNSHDEAVRRYLQRETDTLEATIAQRLAELLNADFRAYSVAISRGETVPRSRVEVPITDPAYFERVADAIAEREKIRPSVRLLNRDLLTMEQLNDEAVVGEIANARLLLNEDRLRLDQYVGGALLPLLPETMRERIAATTNSLEVLKPSQPMLDIFRNAYIFRVTEAADDAPPTDQSQVRERVISDLREKAAYALALEAAETLATQAGDSLQGVAGDRTMRTDPFIPAQGPFDFQNVGGELTRVGLDSLAKGIYRLLPAGGGESDGAGGGGGVMGAPGAIELPSEGRVLAAQVIEASGPWTTTLERAQVISQMRVRAAMENRGSPAILAEFFDPANIASRVKFTSNDSDEE